MSTFSLATLNIHQFHHSSTYDKNAAQLVSLLQPLDLDLIAVQEINDLQHWQTFCKKLDLNHSVDGPCDVKFLWNGIASRHPIVSSSNQSDSLSCPGGIRALLQCRLGGDHPFVKDRVFAVTHLDHLNEDSRLAQIKEFHSTEHNIDVLMGDMNALTREDYSDEYYKDIVAGKREASRWEKPRFDLTKLITEQWSYRDAFRLANPRTKDGEVVTCAYGTWIDYIYLRPQVNDRWKLKRCSISNTQPATDHNAVLAEFEECPNSEELTSMF